MVRASRVPALSSPPQAGDFAMLAEQSPLDSLRLLRVSDRFAMGPSYWLQ
jgi:hypothetical protein